MVKLDTARGLDTLLADELEMFAARLVPLPVLNKLESTRSSTEVVGSADVSEAFAPYLQSGSKSFGVGIF